MNGKSFSPLNTSAAFLLPASTATDEEFEEYVAYAVECRRRVKEQMNKRKPDDEFAQINLSYQRTDGTEGCRVLPRVEGCECYAATRQDIAEPFRGGRSDLGGIRDGTALDVTPTKPAELAEFAAVVTTPAPAQAALELAPAEQHFTILYGDTGHTYESIMGRTCRARKRFR